MEKEVTIISTDRLILRGIDETDTQEIVLWRSEPSVYQFFKSPHKLTNAEHLKWFHNCYLLNENRFDWMCIEKDRGTKIGVFGLIHEGSTAEVNYLLSKEAQHKGYACEVVNALVKFAFDVWRVERIVAEIHKDNLSSMSLVGRLGFKKLSIDGCFITYGLSSQNGR